jgi:peroxiredoxin
MKHIFLLIGLVFTGMCQAQAPFDYEITGRIRGLENDSLVLSVMAGEPGLQRETIILEGENDQFFYKGKAGKIAIVWAQLGTKRNKYGNFTFFLEKGKIIISGNRDSLASTKVTGTPSNNDYSYGIGRMNLYYDQIGMLRAKLNAIQDTSRIEYKNMVAGIGSLYDSVTDFQRDFVGKNPNSLASGMFLYLITDKIPVQELEKLYNNLGDDVKGLGVLAKLSARIEGKKRSTVGSQAPDFTMKDINGNEIKLSDYKGKYILIDFWASWCGPCRKENPYLKDAYNRLKDKNFVIIGVSLDENADKWKQAIEQDQLPWIHISDLKKENRVAQIYGVQPIPDNFLVSPEGKIIGRGFHGVNLGNELAEILKQ